MAINGDKIYSNCDEYGVVEVFDDGNKRYLAFGSGDEQSGQLKSDPSQLLYDYTRAMLLPLLFDRQPEQILLMGLGGGSLANCLYQHCPQTTIHAVELRPQVIAVAHDFFQLPKHRRLKIRCDDADAFLDRRSQRQYNIIFSDIYDANGVDSLQLQDSYIQRCCEQLTEEGWLVINYWRQHRGSSEILPLLKKYFSDIRMCSTGSDNWVVMASQFDHSHSHSELLGQAKELALETGFSLLPMLKKLEKAKAIR